MRALFAALVASLALVSTASAFTVVNNGTIAYRIDGVDNPTLNVVRGRTYTFNITATGHPFYIKTIQGSGTGNAYSNGVTGNGTVVHMWDGNNQTNQRWTVVQLTTARS